MRPGARVSMYGAMYTRQSPQALMSSATTDSMATTNRATHQTGLDTTSLATNHLWTSILLNGMIWMKILDSILSNAHAIGHILLQHGANLSSDDLEKLARARQLMPIWTPSFDHKQVFEKALELALREASDRALRSHP